MVALLTDLQTLGTVVAGLQEQVGQTWRNSSKPPSSDPPNTPPRPTAPASGQKPGGQVGHVGTTRPRLPLAEVDHLVVVRPARCALCDALLLGSDPVPLWCQMTEVPARKAETTKYQVHRLTCQCCGQVTPPWSEGRPPGAVGPPQLGAAAAKAGLGTTWGGVVGDYAKTATTCANLVRDKAALWTLVRVAGVEPTNNAAERRGAVDVPIVLSDNPPGLIAARRPHPARVRNPGGCRGLANQQRPILNGSPGMAAVVSDSAGGAPTGCNWRAGRGG